MHGTSFRRFGFGLCAEWWLAFVRLCSLVRRFVCFRSFSCVGELFVCGLLFCVFGWLLVRFGGWFRFVVSRSISPDLEAAVKG